MSLYQHFHDYCALQQPRLAALGIFRADMLQQGDRASDLDPRFGRKEGQRGPA